MNIWTAFIIIQAVASQPVTLATKPGPADVRVGQQAPAKPDISLKVEPADMTRVDHMTGVEANTYVYSASGMTLTFGSEAMCQAAAKTLRKQSGVASVSCVQTQ